MPRNIFYQSVDLGRSILVWKFLTGGDPGEYAIVFTFDDGTSTHYTEAYQYMLSKGFGKAVTYVFGATGAPGYLTWDQASEMYAAGWDIANHGNHTDMTLWTQEELEVILEACASTIESHGLTRGARHVCYPFGFHNATVDAAMAATGMLTGRDNTWSAFIPDTSPNKYYLPSFPVLSSMSANDVISVVDNAVRSGHVLILQFHKIADAGEPYWSPDKFHALVDWIASNGIVLSNMYDLYQRFYA